MKNPPRAKDMQEKLGAKKKMSHYKCLADNRLPPKFEIQKTSTRRGFLDDDGRRSLTF
jgi:hypothetical protein